MKNKLSISLVFALVLLLVLAATALAQGVGNANPGQNGPGLCENYVDADGDGINDNAPRNGTGEQHGQHDVRGGHHR